MVDSDERSAEETPPANYWTIVSNEKGDMCTAIETEFESNTEPPLTGQIIRRSTMSNQSPCIFKVNDNFDEYIDPIHARSVELEDYIHPIHTSAMITNCVTIRHSSEF
ncbi:hypothetical protein ACJMK2_025687 [Sinanodonta woodiana]|uniref:Uncharacterized protein n=1 Tax=Sinanodonta woodiana TaxID=1069815 RepID=A0ABD3XKR4_SINWO